MEVKIGIINTARELTIEVNQTADEVEASLSEAVSTSALWKLTDERGRRVIVPVAKIGYVDVGIEGSRPVGFGAV
ncbi:MAG: DUF3107 domain-containing protein [Propionibacteriaceae bacterium]|nr:DUF3107 domain-containing protein [Propionibacteriaceae bacterium]